MIYDYIIVGSGLFGAVFAHEANKKGKKVLVLERRNHAGGNVYCEEREGILIHLYGAHIFHTRNKRVWDYVNQFVSFNHFVNSPMAIYEDEIYNLPFNMNTFSKLWQIKTPEEAKIKIAQQQMEVQGKPRNLEEQAIKLVGRDIYERLIKGYTEKQWGRNCSKLPSSIIKRIPVRYTYDNNYFDDPYQGIPVEGYNCLIEKLLEGIEVKLNVDFLKDKSHYMEKGKKIIYTGPIDEYFTYQFGPLEYRSLHFETKRISSDNWQGAAVVNYTSKDVPYTRIIEHKHFAFGKQPYTYITEEYPANWDVTREAYYPINDDSNKELYHKYEALAKNEENVIFGGRMGTYQYLNMDAVIALSLLLCDEELN